jgi:hypothetical protein
MTASKLIELLISLGVAALLNLALARIVQTSAQD